MQDLKLSLKASAYIVVVTAIRLGSFDELRCPLLPPADAVQIVKV
jgi:hypothetical protein